MRISKSVTGSHRLNVAQNLGSRTTHSVAKAVNSTTYADDWMTGQLRSPMSAKRRGEGRGHTSIRTELFADLRTRCLTPTACHESHELTNHRFEERRSDSEQQEAEVPCARSIDFSEPHEVLWHPPGFSFAGTTSPRHYGGCGGGSGSHLWLLGRALRGRWFCAKRSGGQMDEP